MDSLSDTTSPAPLADPSGTAVVTVVAVTYGERRDLLRKVLDALPAQGVGKVVLVDNGARWPVKGELKAAYGDWVDVVEMGQNTGSAQGFGAGMQRALDLGAEYLWLLDDDNRPEPGCLPALLQAYTELRKSYPSERLAVLAFRPQHQADIAAGVPLRYVNPRPNSFRGFHLIDVPYKLMRRTPWGRPHVRGSLPAQVVIDVAPYSGTLFHRTVVERFGLPRADFVLYADDTEFSYRITQSGGRIALITAAAIEDLESSWNVARRHGLSFGIPIQEGSNLRVYYSARNTAYFDTHYLRTSKIIFSVNRACYLLAMTLFAVAKGKYNRLSLVLQAERDGKNKRLGMNEKFPLER